MQFRTPIEITPSLWRISHQNVGLALGSCFSEAVACRLTDLRYPILNNPFGALYNPLSIAHCLRRIVEGREFEATELVEWRGRWFSLDAHTLLAADGPDEALSRLNKALREAHQTLCSADYVILTLGTNFVYETEGRVVANCHRLPADRFVQRALSVTETVSALSEVVELLGDKRILLSVSPIRHLKDGLAASSLSKAVLRVAADELASRFERVTYFPAYEAVVDDLRDYRFYAPDMTHPSEQAVEYVWRLFEQAWLDPSESELNDRIRRFVRACAHRPLDPQSADYREFVQNTLAECETLSQLLPSADFSSERALLLQKLSKK